jgi:hypothetical protein
MSVHTCYIRNRTPVEPRARPSQSDNRPPAVEDNEGRRRLSTDGTHNPPYSQSPSSVANADDQSVDEDEEAELQLLSEDWAPPAEESDRPPLRRSERERKPPKRFEEALSAVLEGIKNSRSYNEALRDHIHGSDWRQAVKEELTQLQALDTWDLSPLPPGKKAIGCRWVFNVKLTPTGLIDRYKARLVA